MAPRRGDTIFALSSAHGRAGIAVLRVSGSQAREAIKALTGKEAQPPRCASLRQLCAPDGAIIDQAIVLWFPAPASATGEDMAEFHVHGGRAVIEAVLRSLAALPGLRPAEPGEFTRRAVENGKLDLTGAEGLADLIDAETEVQRLQALRQYNGALAALYDGWRDRLIGICAWAEAAIDFSEEELEGDLDARVRLEAGRILQEIQRHLGDARVGEITREGLHLTVIGAPNAGKSSLVNALARRDIAIVSETPGTTRDVLEARLDLGGYAVIVADTAGLREVSNAIEAEGVRRALARAEAADLVLLLLDGTAQDPLAGLPADMATGAGLTVWNKADLPWPAPHDGLAISARTGEGLDALIETLIAHVRERLDRPREAPPITRARHRHALQLAADALARAEAAENAELIAEDLRLALRALGRITGRVDVEDLLEIVFREFCIGK